MINERDYKALADAVIADDLNAFKAALAAGAQFESDDNSFITDVARERKPDFVQALVDVGADVNAKNEFSFSALHVAQDRATIDVLLAAGADINMRNDFGSTPLMQQALASGPHADEAFQTLIKHGADVRAVDQAGQTVFQRLFSKFDSAAGEVEMSKIGMLQSLIAAGADVNQPADAHGNRPLHLAKSQAIGSLLIEAGADPFAKNKDGDEPANLMAVKAREEHVLRELATSHRAQAFPSMDQAESYAAAKRAREPVSAEPASDIAPRPARRLV